MSGLARSYQEKRDFIRMQVSAPATLTHSNGNHCRLAYIDLSGSGAQLLHGEALPDNASGRLAISSGGGTTAPLEAEVSICRVQESGPGEFRIGVNIVRFI